MPFLYHFFFSCFTSAFRKAIWWKITCAVKLHNYRSMKTAEKNIILSDLPVYRGMISFVSPWPSPWSSWNSFLGLSACWSYSRADSVSAWAYQMHRGPLEQPKTDIEWGGDAMKQRPAAEQPKQFDKLPWSRPSYQLWWVSAVYSAFQCPTAKQIVWKSSRVSY